MVKLIKILKYSLICVTALALTLLVYGFYAVPDELYKLSDEDMRIRDIYSLNINDSNGEGAARSVCREGKYNVNVSLFNTIPVKSSKMTVFGRRYVVIGGEILGLRLFTQGILVVDTSTVETEAGTRNPAAEAGIKAGDALVSIDGKRLKSCSEASEIFTKSGGRELTIAVRRSGREFTVKFHTAFSSAEQKQLAGLWIRDSAAGIGTMTYYDRATGIFASLGHGVCDSDTGLVLPLLHGDIVNAGVCGCYKGKSGEAGELCGTLTGKQTGLLLMNTDTGVFGLLNSVDENAELTPIALAGEVKTGEAEIISTVDENGPQRFSIQILKLDKNDGAHRNMVIRITDKRLIEKTGGIVQGMSGSPIIQNGMLVGAVTHVFVNEPTKGYAIFAEEMLKTSEREMKESA